MSPGWRGAALLVVVLVVVRAPLCARDLLLRHARLVDPAARTITPRDLLIRDGRIAAPGTTPAADAEAHDLGGRWVIPGLIDLHTHNTGNPVPDGGYEEMDLRECARRMLACGVTAFLNLSATDHQDFFAARDRQHSDPVAHTGEADIHGAGRPFGRWNLRMADEARQTITDYITRWKPDAIKLMLDSSRRAPGPLRQLDHSGLVAAIATARAHGVKTVVHIGTWADARTALEAGADAITHFHDDELIPDDLVALWRAKGAVSIPTMAVQSDMHNAVRGEAWLDSPRLAQVAAPATLASYRDHTSYDDRARGTIHWQRASRAHNSGTLAKLHAAGVPILAGSDTGNLGTFQGFSLHRELLLLQECGLTPWEALAAGTTSAAAFLGRPAGIYPGEPATLVILDADPTSDAAHTQCLYAVVHQGVWFSSSAK